MSTKCFRSVIIYERPWPQNTSQRNTQLTKSSYLHSLPNASPARSANGKENWGAVNGATKSLLASAAPLGVLINAVERGNGNTFGDSLGHLQNAALNITAYAVAVLPHAATARSITWRLAKVRAICRGAIIICNPTVQDEVVSRCCAARITQRSLRHRQRLAQSLGVPFWIRLKLRSD